MNRIDRGSPEELALAIRAHASKQMNSQPAAASSFDDSLEPARIDALRQIGNHSDEQEEELDDESDDESKEELDKEEMIRRRRGTRLRGRARKQGNATD